MRELVINETTCAGCGFPASQCWCGQSRPVANQRQQARRTLTANQRKKIIDEMVECCMNESDRPVLETVSDESLIKVYRKRYESPVAKGQAMHEVRKPFGAPIMETLVAERRAVLNAGTDDQYGKPSMGDQRGRRGQQATSKQASCLRDSDADSKGSPKNGPFADGDTDPDKGSTFSPDGSGSSAGAYLEDHVSELHTPASFLNKYVNSVTPDMDSERITDGALSREGMIMPQSDPLNLNARRAELRAKGIDC